MVNATWKIPGVESLLIDHSVQQSPAVVVVHVKSLKVCPDVSSTLIDAVVLEIGPLASTTSNHMLWVDPIGMELLPNEIFATRPPMVCVEVLSDAVEEEEELEAEKEDELEEEIVVSEIIDVDGSAFVEVDIVVVDFEPPIFDVPSE